MEAGGESRSVTCDHLASFGVTAKQGASLPAAAVGLDRLRQMDSTTGVWAMKVVVRVDRRQITVVDKTSLKVSNTES